jgi:hypothetical protein
MVTGWDPEGATNLLQIVSASLGYTIPETGKMVIFIVHQIISSPSKIRGEGFRGLSSQAVPSVHSSPEGDGNQ